MNLLERIDIALQHARKSRGQLATEIGISVQAISNLKRRPGSTLRPENVARAARALGCDLYWLCTGEGGGYQPHQETGPLHSYLALEVAKFIDTMSEQDRARAFVVVYQMTRGEWPPERPGPGTELSKRRPA